MGEKMSRVIENGKLKMVHKDKGAERACIWKSVYLDQKRDFSISATFTHMKSPAESGCGVVFGLRDEANCYSFTYCPNGVWRFTKYQAGRKYVVREGNGKPYTTKESWQMKISGKPGSVAILINDAVVAQIPVGIWMGLGIGFELPYKGNVSVDDISIEQENTINLLPEFPDTLERINLGVNVNSIHQEKVPLISHDGQTLYFAVYGDPGNIKNPENDDIWITKRTLSGWTPRANIGAPLNNSGHNFVISASPDNNFLLLNNRYNVDGSFMGIGLSTTHRIQTGWSVPQELRIPGYYNLADNKEACLSPEGKVLIFAIQQEDSRGDRDLYVSFLSPQGFWSGPVNLGDQLNTFGTEMSPFIAADGVTLYYATNGLPGYGSHDIFMSKRLDDTWLNWSKPQNLGSQINTPGWDAYYTVPASGEFAYMVSTAGTIGKEDIFRITLPGVARPGPVALLSGRVLNSKTLEPLEAAISFSELETDANIGIARSEPVEGRYKMALPAGKMYSFLAEKDNFIPVLDNIDLTKLETYTEIERDLYLTPMEPGQIVRMNNIFFDFDKASLRKASLHQLNRIVMMLKENPRMKIEIAGHTDNMGADTYNQKLSENRAKAVVDYLIKAGITKDRVTPKGYGEAVPVASNETEEGRQLNRRVEFKILTM